MRSFAQRHPVFWAYLFFAYFSVSYHLLIYVSGMSGWIGVRQSLVMSVLWLVPLLLWPRYTKPTAAAIGIVLWVAATVGLGYWLVYGQDFSQSAIFIIFESNLAEGSEFIESYWRWWFLAVFVGFSLPPVLLWRLLPTFTLTARARHAHALLFTLIAAWPFINSALIKQEGVAVAGHHQLHRLEPAAPWNLVVGYLNYRTQLAAMNDLLHHNHQLAPLANFHQAGGETPNTLVLVIGESTNRQRMSLYGYPRATSPQLDAMRDELIVFDNVVSPRPYTIEALQQALSFADSKDPGAFYDQPLLLNMIKQAGYDITWITNQQTQTRRNTMLTMFSQLADHQVYLNNNRAQNSSQYDGEVLEPFVAALANPAPKKLIVVHLLGTHRKYEYRYPDNFAEFDGNMDLPLWVEESNRDEYNRYDNAVLYNDSVIAELIDGLHRKNDNSMLVYFSDHGEEVYDYPEKQFCGRNEGAPSPAMYTIPFIVWASPQWQLSHDMQPWQAYTDRPFSIADLIYTVPDMIGIDFDGMDHSRSLVAKTFTPHPRWIGDPAQPDELTSFATLFDPIQPGPIQLDSAQVTQKPPAIPRLLARSSDVANPDQTAVK